MRTIVTSCGRLESNSAVEAPLIPTSDATSCIGMAIIIMTTISGAMMTEINPFIT